MKTCRVREEVYVVRARVCVELYFWPSLRDLQEPHTLLAREQLGLRVPGVSATKSKVRKTG